MLREGRHPKAELVPTHCLVGPLDTNTKLRSEGINDGSAVGHDPGLLLHEQTRRALESEPALVKVDHRHAPQSHDLLHFWMLPAAGLERVFDEEKSARIHLLASTNLLEADF